MSMRENTSPKKKKQQKRIPEPRLGFCLFCGHDRISVMTWWSDKFKSWGGQARCDHCDAGGSNTTGFDTREEAVECAVKNWNEAYRPSAFRLWLTRFPTQIRYDIGLFFDDLRDRVLRRD